MAEYTSSKPRFQVISCGLPRTGTTTTGRALSILLAGPVFDGGSDSFRGPPQRQRLLLSLASLCPVRTSSDRILVLDHLRELTEGCVASTDQPGCYFIEELLELYPNAKVICTTRERESWWASYVALWSSIYELYTHPLLWLSPSLRRFCVFSFEFWRRVPQAVGMTNVNSPPWPMVHQEELYERHAQYVRRVVPEGQLYFFDVRDGWAPLCNILGVEVPKEPFPHEFPRSWLTSGKAALVAKLRRRFALLLTVIGSVGFMFWRWKTGQRLFPMIF
ncbi:uncharacterized protein PV09_08316 [Verruconis gallopava]|uniref:NAD dependent epimerase/dehydratase n=1 Tax=Verruconis gallopava TaxID=253628 RepID=A0A0D2A0H2_9PEZI|nr:uncharacterized protein PV09_08316 [Verruconis gallopava]KIW00138.1 hypothetical protein PV09_08316 [Verruconis gallopava]